MPTFGSPGHFVEEEASEPYPSPVALPGASVKPQEPGDCSLKGHWWHPQLSLPHVIESANGHPAHTSQLIFTTWKDSRRRERYLLNANF